MTKRETVKIDEDLLKRVILIIKDKNKRIKYSSAKQFVNLAVIELLEKEEKWLKGGIVMLMISIV